MPALQPDENLSLFFTKVNRGGQLWIIDVWEGGKSLNPDHIWRFPSQVLTAIHADQLTGHRFGRQEIAKRLGYVVRIRAALQDC